MTRWTHELPMRWADIDMLNHVNNVTYVEYAAEAHALLTSDGQLRAEQPSEVTVTFLRPVLLSSQPIVVSSSLDGDLLTQEIGSSASADVAARVVSGWAEVDAPVIPAGAEGPVDLRVRIGDVDGDGHVTTAKLFELCQESRVRLISQRLNNDAFGRFVVGTVAVRIHGAVDWRPEPYQAHGWLGRVGEGSFTVHNVITDGDRPLVSATSILVGFDMETQRSRRFTDAERAAMTGLLLS